MMEKKRTGREKSVYCQPHELSTQPSFFVPSNSVREPGCLAGSPRGWKTADVVSLIYPYHLFLLHIFSLPPGRRYLRLRASEPSLQFPHCTVHAVVVRHQIR